MKYLILEVLFSAWDANGNNIYYQKNKEITIAVDSIATGAVEQAAEREIKNYIIGKYGLGPNGEEPEVDIIEIRTLRIFGRLIDYEEAKYEIEKRKKK